MAGSCSHTWRTVSGCRTPHWSHMAIMPFLTAITPVLRTFLPLVDEEKKKDVQAKEKKNVQGHLSAQWSTPLRVGSLLVLVLPLLLPCWPAERQPPTAAPSLAARKPLRKWPYHIRRSLSFTNQTTHCTGYEQRPHRWCCWRCWRRWCRPRSCVVWRAGRRGWARRP